MVKNNHPRHSWKFTIGCKASVLQHEMDGLCVATEAVRSEVLVNLKNQVV